MGGLCSPAPYRAAWDRFSDRCGRLFPSFSDPVRRHTIVLKTSLVLLHVVFAGTLFLLDTDLIQKFKREHWYAASYTVLFLATLVQYFVTSGTSPGSVLDAQRAVDERDALAKRTALGSNQPASSKNDSVVITVVGRYQQRVNPSAWTELVMDLYPPGTPPRNFTCTFCHVIQPPRTKHCHECDKCILQFDHHCVWLGTCVGQKNHCRFWWYIFLETALGIWTSNLYIAYLKSHVTKSWWAYMIIIVLLAALLFTLIFLVLLLMFHSFLIMTNQTTYELVRRRRIAYLRGIPERVYPFSHGVCRNLRLFCCTWSSRLEALPTTEEIERRSTPYTWSDVLHCRCC